MTIDVTTKTLRGSDKKPYFPHRHLIDAMNAAIVLGRPLLLTGEPGCGKSEFAAAVASYYDVELLRAHVRSDSRARDLLYHYDALRRFGDAHLDGRREHARDPRRYVEILDLGRALVSPSQQVVLVDEIDKAPRDLPNDLLREIERKEFVIPEIPEVSEDDDLQFEGPAPTSHGLEIRRTMTQPFGAPAPIVIITSNVERQLPDPFLRRCVFFHIRFPKKERLTEILRSKVGSELLYLEQAVTLFEALRGEEQRLTKLPATSELIDWVKVLTRMTSQREIETTLAELASLVERRKDKAVLTQRKRWKELPAMHCLLKMRQDLEAVGYRHSG